ncbi:MAG: DUF1800 domain-containing protein [Bacteroidota bacterium]
MNIYQRKHLFSRAGFGVRMDQWEKLKHTSHEEILQYLFSSSRKAEPLIIQEENPFAGRGRQGMLSQEKRKEMKKENRKLLRDLNIAWVNRMASTEAQLREKMTFFWHDHFACRRPGIMVNQRQNNVLRAHALGKFGDLVLAVAQDPAMLLFLNNQQNRKEHPNENFARELLELFTLGRGNYTEEDIKEAARAFTGWSTNVKGEFFFRARRHDYGKKRFMGKTGNFGGEDIINIVLENRQTATYITTKLYRFLVNPSIDKEVVDTWAKSFYESEYDIASLLKTIFTANHFYEKQHIGARIKSPVEYLVSLMRLLDMTFDNPEGILFMEKALGQILFVPPGVDGWPDGKNWIDSNTLMTRLRIPLAIIFSSEMAVGTKEDFSGNEDLIKLREAKKIGRKLQASINWNPILSYLASKDEAQSVASLKEYLLQVDTPHLTPEFLLKYSRKKSEEESLKWMSMRLLCTPEFQLC